VGHEPGDLVPHLLGGDDGHLASHALVGVEVQSQLRVVLLDDDTRGLLYGLSTDTLWEEGEIGSERTSQDERPLHIMQAPTQLRVPF